MYVRYVYNMNKYKASISIRIPKIWIHKWVQVHGELPPPYNIPKRNLPGRPPLLDQMVNRLTQHTCRRYCVFENSCQIELLDKSPSQLLRTCGYLQSHNKASEPHYASGILLFPYLFWWMASYGLTWQHQVPLPFLLSQRLIFLLGLQTVVV